MNDAMWEHAATQDNVARLRARGVTVLEPGVGALGSIGEHGAGRLPEPPDLLAAVEAALETTRRDLDGLRVLVTAGGTREPIDAVRYVGNRSSGRMGFALAEAAARRGAEVAVVAANVALPRHPGVTYLDVETAAQLRDACASAFDRADVLLMAAAVADYRPARAAGRQDQEGRPGRGAGTRARAHHRRARRAVRAPPRRPDPGRLRRRGGRGGGRLRARQAAPQGARRRRRQRHQRRPASASTRPTTRSRSSPPATTSPSRRARRQSSRLPSLTWWCACGHPKQR